MGSADNNDANMDSVLARVDKDHERVDANEFNPQDEIKNLSEQIQDMKKLLDQTTIPHGKDAEFYEKLTEYIDDISIEAKEVRKIRNWSVCLAVALAVFLLTVSAILIFSPEYAALGASSNYFVPLIISFTLSPVALMAIILRSSFTNRTDRHKDKDHKLPENVKMIWETLNDSKNDLLK